MIVNCQLENNIFQHLWGMQDAAPAQKLLAVIQRMGQVFGNRVVALYHDVEEPPQSSYLTHVISSCGVS